MGLKRRRRSGMGLSGLLIIGAVLYFTGAGKWLWERAQQLEGQCYTMAAQSGVQQANAACTGVGKMIHTVGQTVGETIDSVKDGARNLWANVTGGGHVPTSFGEIRISGALEKFSSGTSRLPASEAGTCR